MHSRVVGLRLEGNLFVFLKIFLKVIGQDQSHMSKKSRKPLFPQCKTSIGNKFGSIKQGAMAFAYSMWFSDTADRMV